MLVVEHKPQVIAIADHVVDMGPGAGAQGGKVVYRGRRRRAAQRPARSPATTSRQHAAAQGRRCASRPASCAIKHAKLHNLRDVTVDVPLGVLTVVTGVAGSGKSSLIHGCLPRSTTT